MSMNVKIVLSALILSTVVWFGYAGNVSGVAGTSSEGGEGAGTYRGTTAPPARLEDKNVKLESFQVREGNYYDFHLLLQNNTNHKLKVALFGDRDGDGYVYVRGCEPSDWPDYITLLPNETQERSLVHDKGIHDTSDNGVRIQVEGSQDRLSIGRVRSRMMITKPTKTFLGVLSFNCESRRFAPLLEYTRPVIWIDINNDSDKNYPAMHIVFRDGE